MKTRLILYADEGKILTDGTCFGKVIHLAEGANSSLFYEISTGEYEEILQKQQEEIL